jgi:hypothetical protein
MKQAFFLAMILVLPVYLGLFYISYMIDSVTENTPLPPITSSTNYCKSVKGFCVCSSYWSEEFNLDLDKKCIP